MSRPHIYKFKPSKFGEPVFRRHEGVWQRQEAVGGPWKTLEITKGEPPPDPRMSVNKWSWH